MDMDNPLIQAACVEMTALLAASWDGKDGQGDYKPLAIVLPWAVSPLGEIKLQWLQN
jgi:hypothetical protein